MDAKPTTPNQASGFSDLSPPSSQSAPLPSPHANANGKRPISTLDNHTDLSHPMTRSAAAVAAREAEQQEVQTHQPSGYTWRRTEDEPGHVWKDKRAVEESERAWTMILHKDRKVGNRYGDPYEMADYEAAILASRGG
ncbi:hypothetical protein BDZ85DRAFT_266483 [Elsinoe ampelina]|uniref:Uncharacterized protein n=1 Tax=Elsinoe ampelina TaxID=302913 RepID=A0A6A6G626_9PEZI|nr:hypothetical protein BDZ85DRAFT_266483 [Elsinoe ampelina]